MKNLIIYVCLASLLLVGVADVYAAGQYSGKITKISGKIITLKNSQGSEKLLEVSSVIGVKIGMIAFCEEDCGRTIRVGDKIINVVRVLPPPPEAPLGRVRIR